jgi:molybdopterin synthase sulfur carrier subunit
MTIRVLLFASYADALGTPELALELEPGARVRDVIERVKSRAGAHALPPNPLVAVNASYAEPEHALAPDDEVAIIPPVAGG